MKCLWILVVAVTCGVPNHAPDALPQAPMKLPGLSNVMNVSDGLTSGSAPLTPKAFESLVGLGIKTIISVDGSTPKVDMAFEWGMRYVHLPIRYAGITKEEGARIARAVRDLPKPIYIHCLHGTARAPSAAAYAEVALGELDHDAGIDLLHRVGTPPGYQGLFDAVASCPRLDKKTLDAVSGDFPPRAVVSNFTTAMVRIGQVKEVLEQVSAAGWHTPASHPDVTPEHEFEQLRQHLAQARTLAQSEKRPADFVAGLKRALSAADTLTAAKGADRTAAFDELRHRCTACHIKYRD